jgi:hypothetical protein
MANGRIKAIGDSMGLKNKYGAGYKISIICDPSKIRQTKDLVRKNMASAVLEDDSAGALLYQFPNSSLTYIGKLVEKLNVNPFVKGWGLSQTTLEQVFLSVVRNVDEDGMKTAILAVDPNRNDMSISDVRSSPIWYNTTN